MLGAAEGTRSSDRFERSLAAAGQMIAVSAVMAPAVGVFIRFAGFFGDHDIRSAFMLASSLPLQELTAAGLESMIVSGLVLSIVLLVYVLYRPSPAGRALTRAELVVLGFFIVVIASFSPNFPAGLLGLAGGLVAGLMLGRTTARAGHQLSLKITPAVLAFVVLSTLSSGLTLKLAADSYHFASGSGLNDGSYVRLGESNGFTILRSCTAGFQRVEAVPITAISRIDLLPPAATADRDSFWDWLLHGAAPVLGVRYVCP